MLTLSRGRGGYFFGFGEFFGVIVECPEIEHDDCVFGDKVTFVPVVLDDGVVLAEFIDRSPSECFLRQIRIR